MNIVTVFVLFGVAATSPDSHTTNVIVIAPEVYSSASKCLRDLSVNKDQLSKKYEKVELNCVEKKIVKGK